MKASQTASPRVRPKWHYLYFLLAAFDVLTVCAGLYLTHEIMAIYTRSVAVNQLWTERAAAFSRLADLAGAVNAPGNDVFDNRDVATEEKRMQRALARFNDELAALRKPLVGHQAPPEAAGLIAHLDRVSTAMDHMIEEANQIFEHFSDRRADLAGARMASMDRSFAALLSAIAELRVAVTGIQQQNFARQTAAAARLQQYEYGIGLMILLMVVAATWYGHRIARQMQAHAAERERHLAALGEAEARVHSILDTVADGIIAFDERGRIGTINPAAEFLFGFPGGAATDRNVRDLLPRNAWPGSPLQQVLNADPSAPCDLTVAAAECQRADGTTFPAEIAATRMPVPGQRAFVCVIRDITAHVEAERALHEERDRLQMVNDKLRDTHNQLVQSDKMAAIGQLAAGVAHEINNPMAFIASNVSTFESDVAALLDVVAAYETSADPLLAGDPARRAGVDRAKAGAELVFLREDLPKLFEETRDGVKRVRMIVQDLKELSHTGSNEWQSADLHKGIDSTLNVVRNEIKYKADVVKEYGQLPPVECIAPQINQVIMNLLVNAAQAIEEHGTITVRTGREDAMVWVEIEDTGSGIPPQNLKRIFEPFFTTKPVGKGTGLGLSLCYSIVRKHGGRIEVKSEPGKGSAFRLWLPIERTAGAAAPATAAAGAAD